MQAYATAAPGSIIDLEVPPHSVNVRLEELEQNLLKLGQSWPEDETLASLLPEDHADRFIPETASSDKQQQNAPLKIIVPIRLSSTCEDHMMIFFTTVSYKFCEFF